MSKSKKVEKTETQVRLRSLGQYTRKMSFDIIKTPYELSEFPGLKHNLAFKLGTEKLVLGDNNHEVILLIEAELNIEDTKENIFKVAMEYSGIFSLEGDMSQEIEDEILLVNCVTLLFPFARQQLAEMTLAGGYKPIMLDPIDFRQAYLQSKQKNINNA